MSVKNRTFPSDYRESAVFPFFLFQKKPALFHLKFQKIFYHSNQAEFHLEEQRFSHENQLKIFRFRLGRIFLWFCLQKAHTVKNQSKKLLEHAAEIQAFLKFRRRVKLSQPFVQPEKQKKNHRLPILVLSAEKILFQAAIYRFRSAHSIKYFPLKK